MREYHLIEPVYNKSSKILILGSFPSVKSRRPTFFIIIRRIVFGKFLQIFIILNYQRLLLKRKNF